MLKNDLIIRNPLRILGNDSDDILTTGQAGAVLARAGVGKTAFLVQLALNKMLREMNVLHISLEDPVNKVSLWYKEVFNNIAEQYQVEQLDQLWESILPHRFIMTFRAESFSLSTLEERLTDLTEQGIFNPQMIIVDGLPFEDESVRGPLAELKILIEKNDMHGWFTVLTHRHEELMPDGTPRQLALVNDIFDVAIRLNPIGKKIQVQTVKGVERPTDKPELFLDPTTMLIKKNDS